jgi:hypothetical protein
VYRHRRNYSCARSVAVLPEVAHPNGPPWDRYSNAGWWLEQMPDAFTAGRRLLVWFAAVSATGLGASCTQAPQRSAAALAAGCRVVERSRTPIRLGDGQLVYVEPEAFAAAGRKLSLAGAPNYMWPPMPGTNEFASRANTILGVLVDRDARGSAVAPPIDAGRVHDVRAAGRSDGTWGDAATTERLREDLPNAVATSVALVADTPSSPPFERPSHP